MRKVMMAGALKRNDSRPEAESSSASTVPATMITAPRSASRPRHRFRTRRMTSTSSVRGSMRRFSLRERLHPASASRSPKGVALQELLFAREVVRDYGFRRQQQQTGHQQVPPQTLTPLRLFPRHL